MATGAHTAQAVGMAAAQCRREGVVPRDLVEPPRMKRLQHDLLRAGQHIPGQVLRDDANLVESAVVTASSRLMLRSLPASGEVRPLHESLAMLLPVAAGEAPRVAILLDVQRPTKLRATLRASRRPDEFTPAVQLAEVMIDLQAGQRQQVQLGLAASFAEERYAFWCLEHNPDVAVHVSDLRVSGVLSLVHRNNRAVAKAAVQKPPEGSGMHSFEFWTPERRPGGKNLALTIDPPLDRFGPDQLVSGVDRPTCRPNIWVADPGDPLPAIHVAWDTAMTIGRVELLFDTDFDHPMESVLMGHPERLGPFCARDATLRDEHGRQLAQILCNHETRRIVRFDPPVVTRRLLVEVAHPGGAPAALAGLRCYGP